MLYILNSSTGIIRQIDTHGNKRLATLSADALDALLCTLAGLNLLRDLSNERREAIQQELLFHFWAAWED